jgi:hypothetical protein
LWTAMFAFPTVVAAFAPIWVALLFGISIFIFSLALFKKNWIKINVTTK